MHSLELTRFTKRGGWKTSSALTKRISLVDGKVKSDGSDCLTCAGTAQRVIVSGVTEFARLITGLASSEAISLGA